MDNAQEFVMLYNPMIGNIFTIVCRKQEVLSSKIIILSISLILFIPIISLFLLEKKIVGATFVASMLAIILMYRNVKNVNIAKEVGYSKVKSIVPLLGMVCILEFAIPILIRWSHGTL